MVHANHNKFSFGEIPSNALCYKFMPIDVRLFFFFLSYLQIQGLVFRNIFAILLLPLQYLTARIYSPNNLFPYRRLPAVTKPMSSKFATSWDFSTSPPSKSVIAAGSCLVFLPCKAFQSIQRQL